MTFVGDDLESYDDDAGIAQRNKQRHLEVDGLAPSRQSVQRKDELSQSLSISSDVFQEEIICHHEQGNDNAVSTSSHVSASLTASPLERRIKIGCKRTRSAMDGSNSDAVSSSPSTLPDLDEEDRQAFKFLGVLKEPQVVLRRADVLLKLSECRNVPTNKTAPMESTIATAKVSLDSLPGDPIANDAKPCDAPQDSVNSASPIDGVYSEQLRASDMIRKESYSHLPTDVEREVQCNSLLPSVESSHIHESMLTDDATQITGAFYPEGLNNSSLPSVEKTHVSETVLTNEVEGTVGVLFPPGVENELQDDSLPSAQRTHVSQSVLVSDEIQKLPSESLLSSDQRPTMSVPNTCAEVQVPPLKSLDLPHAQRETSLESSVLPVNSSLDLFATSNSLLSSGDMPASLRGSQDPSHDEVGDAGALLPNRPSSQQPSLNSLLAETEGDPQKLSGYQPSLPDASDVTYDSCELGLLRDLCSQQSSGIASQELHPPREETCEQPLEEVSGDRLPCLPATCDVVQESFESDLLKGLCSAQGSDRASQESSYQQSSPVSVTSSRDEEPRDKLQEVLHGSGGEMAGVSESKRPASPSMDGKHSNQIESVANVDFSLWSSSQLALKDLCSLQGSGYASQEPAGQSASVVSSTSSRADESSDEVQEESRDTREAGEGSGRDGEPPPDEGRWNYRMDPVRNANFTPWVPTRPRISLVWEKNSGHLRRRACGLRLVRTSLDPKTKELAVDSRVIPSLEPFNVEPLVDCSKIASCRPSSSARRRDVGSQPAAGSGPTSTVERKRVGVRPQVLDVKVVAEEMNCDVFESDPERENDSQLRISLSSPSPLATHRLGK